jgi:hypothetical protein
MKISSSRSHAIRVKFLGSLSNATVIPEKPRDDMIIILLETISQNGRAISVPTVPYIQASIPI